MIKLNGFPLKDVQSINYKGNLDYLEEFLIREAMQDINILNISLNVGDGSII